MNSHLVSTQRKQLGYRNWPSDYLAALAFENQIYWHNHYSAFTEATVSVIICNEVGSL